MSHELVFLNVHTVKMGSENSIHIYRYSMNTC